MAFKKKFSGKKKDSKYLRLTGLWQSKKNDALWTGRMKPDQLEDLLNRVNEAGEADAPLVFSLWLNEERESKRDAEFSLQCFVGDTDEQPRSSRFGKKKFGKKVEEESEEEEEESDGEEEGEEEIEEEETTKKSTKKKFGKTKTKSKKEDW